MAMGYIGLYWAERSSQLVCFELLENIFNTEVSLGLILFVASAVRQGRRMLFCLGNLWDNSISFYG